MKLTNEICILFLQGSGLLYNHDKEITISERNNAIDDAIDKISCGGKYNMSLVDELRKLKDGGENDD